METAVVGRSTWARLRGLITPRVALWILVGGFALATLLRDVRAHGFLREAVPEGFGVVPLARDRISLGIDPYVPGERWPYKYSPFTALAYLVLPRSHAAAWRIFQALMLAGWAGALAWGVPRVTWRRVSLAALGIALSYAGFMETLYWGQIDILLLIVAVLAAISFGRLPLVSAFFLGVLPWVKLPWGFIWLPFLAEAWRRDRATLARAVAGLGAASLFCGLLLPVAVVGWGRTVELTRSWLHLVGSQPAAIFADRDNQCVWQSLIRWFGPAGDSVWVRAAVCLGLAGAVWALLSRARRRETAPLAWISPWLLLTQLISPLGWAWGSLLVVGVPLSFEKASEGRARTPLFWVFAAIAALCYPFQRGGVAPFLGFGTGMEFLDHGTVTLFWLALLGLVLCEDLSLPA